jgi:hypothetical protein
VQRNEIPYAGLLLIAFAAALGGTQNRPQSFLPAPTGPYGVGRASLQWSDESRADAESPNGHRQLVVLALVSRQASKFNERLATWQMGRTSTGLGCSGLIPLRQPLERGINFVNPKSLVRRCASLPVSGRLLYFCSLPVRRTPLNYASLIADLASYGYIVAGIVPPHSGSCVYSNERIVEIRSRTQFEVKPLWPI